MEIKILQHRRYCNVKYIFINVAAYLLLTFYNNQTNTLLDINLQCTEVTGPASPFPLPRSSALKPAYLVSSSWSHTAARPCPRYKPFGFPPDGSEGSVCVWVCVCVCECVWVWIGVWGTEQWPGRHHVFISVTTLHPTSAIQLQETLRGVCVCVCVCVFASHIYVNTEHKHTTLAISAVLSRLIN